MNQKTAKTKPATDFTSDQIKDWLHCHPDFFEQHLDLLETIKIPHPSGEAVSLVSKQLELLREKNKKSQHQLENLIQVARENDGLFRRMQQLTLALMETETLEETITTLTTMLQECFLADFISLRIIGEPAENLTTIKELFVSPDNKNISLFEKILASNRPKCGHSLHNQAQFLFGENGVKTLSSAILPLQLGAYRGLLGIGSTESDRFHPSMGNLFLDHISELVNSRLTTQLNQ